MLGQGRKCHYNSLFKTKRLCETVSKALFLLLLLVIFGITPYSNVVHLMAIVSTCDANKLVFVAV